MDIPRVALIHDYLVQYGGAEKTLEIMSDIFPEAEIFTGIYKPDLLSKKLNSKKIISPGTSLLSKWPKYFTFLMPLYFENFDLRNYDLIISSGNAWAKGVLTKPTQLHISYVHTPPRFLYKYSVESTNRNNWYYKPFVSFIDTSLRVWDYISAQRPDYLLTNSRETSKRIQKFYRREATVIYPPVDVETKPAVESDNLKAPYYLAAGRLAAYKNFDLIIQAFNLLGLPLEVIGTGKEESKLKKMAKDNIKFLGQTSDEVKFQKMNECLGLIFPVEEEDFGIVPIEAMSQGKPVLAHRSGGILETLRDGIDGMFFDKVTLEEFVSKMKEFDENIKKSVYNSNSIRDHVQKYSVNRFKKEFEAFVSNKWDQFLYEQKGATFRA